jgi:hypothetical protein
VANVCSGMKPPKAVTGDDDRLSFEVVHCPWGFCRADGPTPVLINLDVGAKPTPAGRGGALPESARSKLQLQVS